MNDDLLNRIKAHLAGQKALYAQARQELELNHQFINKLQKTKADHSQAKEIILAVSKDMRLQVKGLLEHLVTMAIHAIFDESIKFVVNIDEDKSEVAFSLEKSGTTQPIVDFVGEGLVDVISFALRICILLLSRRPKILILDEPFKFLNKDRHAAAGELIARLSNDLGIQFLIVTHSDTLLEGGDKVFKVELRQTNNGKMSRVTEL